MECFGNRAFRQQDWCALQQLDSKLVSSFTATKGGFVKVAQSIFKRGQTMTFVSLFVVITTIRAEIQSKLIDVMICQVD